MSIARQFARQGDLCADRHVLAVDLDCPGSVGEVAGAGSFGGEADDRDC
jgi:hypothetical protein